MTPLALAAWSLSAILLFLPVVRIARFAQGLRGGGGRESDRTAPATDAAGERPGPLAQDRPSSVDADDTTDQHPGSLASRRRLALLRSTGTLVIYGVFVVTSVYLAPRLIARVLDTEHPMAAVTSQSMYPVLKKGDLVFIEGVDDVSDLKVGDIVAFEHLSGFAIHRAVEIDGDTITTKGDANSDTDPPITFDQVVGRAFTVRGHLAKLPYLGNIPLVVGRASEVDAAAAEPPAEAGGGSE